MSNNSTSKKIHISLGIIGIIFVVIFTLQNTEVVSISFLFWKLEMSRVIMILAVLIIGFLLGYVFNGVRKR
ncbi:MAG: LapA family protein [Gammaproteobacteria bacterium]